MSNTFVWTPGFAGESCLDVGSFPHERRVRAQLNASAIEYRLFA
jgi:hypothetical protein